MNESFKLNQEPAADVFELSRSVNKAWWWVKANVAQLLCALFIGAMSLNMLAVISRKSLTVDETVMIPAAYYHLAAGNFQLVHEHPPLSKILAAIPLLFIQPKELNADQVKGKPHTLEAESEYGGRFWLDNRTLFETISFWTRVPMIALTAALGVLIFVFARDLFGPRAAVLAVALFALEPTVLAHGRVVQTDVPAAFGLLLVCFAFYRYFLQRGWKQALLLGLACGIALLSKFSTLMIAPVLLITFIVMLATAKGWRKILITHALLVVVSTLLVIQTAYFFQSRSLVAPDLVWINHAFPTYGSIVETSVRALSYLLPTDFVLGAFWQLWHGKEGHTAGLLGMYRKEGWWYYFPLAFALKTSLPFFIISISALAWATYEIIRKPTLKFLILLVPFVIYTAFVMTSTINIGVRYYLPAYMFLMVLGGALLDRMLLIKSPKLVGTGIVIILVGWSAIETFRTYPNYMSYMNQIATSQPKWWYLSDSNVEWGDEIKTLADYLHARGESRVQSALLGGYIILPFYGIENFDLIGPSGKMDWPATRYIAIGASFLNGSTVSPPDRFAEYRHRTPEAVFGDSIYLYRLSE